MKLYLMRHGPAEDRADSGLDGDRALTEAGRKRVRGVGRMLVDVDEAPAHIVASPLVRAVQTAEIVALVTKLESRSGTVEVRRELSPGSGAEAAAMALRLSSDNRKRVLFVGHEPDLSAVASSLLGSFERPFDKAMVVGIKLPLAGMPRLRFVLDAKTLRFEPLER
jgi:phosphohistidine phosphatase